MRKKRERPVDDLIARFATLSTADRNLFVRRLVQGAYVPTEGRALLAKDEELRRDRETKLIQNRYAELMGRRS